MGCAPHSLRNRPLQGGEGGDPLRRNGEGEVGSGERSGIPHLTPTLSAPGAGEGAGIAATPADALTAARRVVLKIGSALLVEDDGEIRRAWLDALVDDVARCRRRGQER